MFELRRVSRSNYEAVFSRFAWAIGIASFAQALSGIVVFGLGFLTGGWSAGTTTRDAALVGLSETGMAAALAVLAVRPALVDRSAPAGGSSAL